MAHTLPVITSCVLILLLIIDFSLPCFRVRKAASVKAELPQACRDMSACVVIFRYYRWRENWSMYAGCMLAAINHLLNLYEAV